MGVVRKKEKSNKMKLILLLSIIVSSAIAFDINLKSKFDRGLCCLGYNAQSMCSTQCSGRSCTDSCTVRCGILSSVCGTYTCSTVASSTCTATTAAAPTTAAPTTAAPTTAATTAAATTPGCCSFPPVAPCTPC